MNVMSKPKFMNASLHSLNKISSILSIFIYYNREDWMQHQSVSPCWKLKPDTDHNRTTSLRGGQGYSIWGHNMKVHVHNCCNGDLQLCTACGFTSVVLSHIPGGLFSFQPYLNQIYMVLNRLIMSVAGWKQRRLEWIHSGRGVLQEQDWKPLFYM